MIESQNKGWGFYGEAFRERLRGKHGPDYHLDKISDWDRADAHQYAASRFEAAAAYLLENGLLDNPDLACRYLDSRFGRHLHDAAPDGNIGKVSWLAKDTARFKRYQS